MSGNTGRRRTSHRAPVDAGASFWSVFFGFSGTYFGTKLNPVRTGLRIPNKTISRKDEMTRSFISESFKTVCTRTHIRLSIAKF